MEILKNNKIKEIPFNLIDKIYKNSISKTKPFFSLDKKIVGESHLKKIVRVSKFLKNLCLHHSLLNIILSTF